MEKVKKGLRLLVLLILLILAFCGIPIFGNFLNNREPYRDREITTEQTDKKEDEENDEQSKLG
jgi:hypothetical protein